MKQKVLQPLIVAGCLTILLILAVGSSLRAAAGAEKPDDATCVGCHDGYDKTLSQTVHRLSSLNGGATPTIACVSCHSGGEQHMDNPSKDNISNPSRLAGQSALEACAACHLPHQDMDSYGFNAHTQQQLNCSSCHRVHGTAPAVGLLLDDKTEFCGGCHTDIKATFMRRSNHPVRQGAMTCLSCHRFSKRADRNQSYDFARVCQDCHGDVAGPYPYEHAAMNSYDVQGSGCVECHDPHGSVNDKLLRQPGNALCSQCHTVPGHRTAHDGAYATLDCLTCHTDIHGSAANRQLVDPNLGAKLGHSCYCHSLN